MHAFQVGDKVQRINFDFDGFRVGDVETVTRTDSLNVFVTNHKSSYDPSNLELIDRAYNKISEEKPPMDILLQLRGLDDVASVMGFGEVKHGRFSFRSIEKDKRIELLGKAMRHMFSHAQGKKLDDETGRPNLAHAICDLMMALDLEKGS